MSKFRNLPMSEIHFNESFNCREGINPVTCADLARNIEQYGLTNPIAVMEYTDEEVTSTGKKYLLLAGHRRYTAYRILERDTVPCFVHPNMPIQARLIFNLSENFQRADLTILDEAKAIANLVNIGMTRSEICAALQRTVGWVQTRIYVLRMPEEVKKEIGVGNVTTQYIGKLHTILNEKGVDDCVNAALTCKKAKQRGEKPVLNVPQTPKTIKKPRQTLVRSQAEIMKMIEYIGSTDIGYDTQTACLAWASGNIEAAELHKVLNKYANDLNIIYVIPTEEL